MFPTGPREGEPPPLVAGPELGGSPERVQAVPQEPLPSGLARELRAPEHALPGLAVELPPGKPPDAAPGSEPGGVEQSLSRRPGGS
jgi:hypothetical protein